jgi:DNA-binding NarL/FixJ family response regulator
MMRAVVVADSGPAAARLSEAVDAHRAVEIVRCAQGSDSLEALLRAHEPDLVFIDAHWPALALARVAEARRAAPGAAVFVLAAWPAADWLADALRTGAAAVLPSDVDPRTLHRVIDEVRAAPARLPTGFPVPATSIACAPAGAARTRGTLDPRDASA